MAVRKVPNDFDPFTMTQNPPLSPAQFQFLSHPKRTIQHSDGERQSTTSSLHQPRHGNNAYHQQESSQSSHSFRRPDRRWINYCAPHDAPDNWRAPYTSNLGPMVENAKPATVGQTDGWPWQTSMTNSRPHGLPRQRNEQTRGQPQSLRLRQPLASQVQAYQGAGLYAPHEKHTMINYGPYHNTFAHDMRPSPQQWSLQLLDNTKKANRMNRSRANRLNSPYEEQRLTVEGTQRPFHPSLPARGASSGEVFLNPKQNASTQKRRVTRHHPEEVMNSSAYDKQAHQKAIKSNAYSLRIRQQVMKTNAYNNKILRRELRRKITAQRPRGRDGKFVAINSLSGMQEASTFAEGQLGLGDERRNQTTSLTSPVAAMYHFVKDSHYRQGDIARRQNTYNPGPFPMADAMRDHDGLTLGEGAESWERFGRKTSLPTTKAGAPTRQNGGENGGDGVLGLGPGQGTTNYETYTQGGGAAPNYRPAESTSPFIPTDMTGMWTNPLHRNT